MKIILTIEVPDGADVGVTTSDLDEAPWPGGAATTRQVQEAMPAATDRCPAHPDREPRQGKFGLFCSATGQGPGYNAKGYCDWKP